MTSIYRPIRHTRGQQILIARRKPVTRQSEQARRQTLRRSGMQADRTRPYRTVRR